MFDLGVGHAAKIHGDARPGSTAAAGASCSLEGGRCIGNAIAEAVFGYQSNELVPGCTGLTVPGWPCERGWRPGGPYVVERVVGQVGSCGDGTCGDGEYPATCPADCGCGDGVCAPAEVGSCTADCGFCGNGIRDPWETPKNCRQDAPVAADDGSCDPSEVGSNSADCGCGALSAGLSDFPGRLRRRRVYAGWTFAGNLPDLPAGLRRGDR